MSIINKAAVLNPLLPVLDTIVDYIPRATTSKFGVVSIGSGINVDALGRIYLDTQEYSDRLSAIEAQAASSLSTQQTAVATAIAQVNLTQSQTITALTLEVNNLKTSLTNSIAATETNLINRADQLAQNVTDITDQLALDKAAFTQEIQDALVYLENASSVASALRTPRKIQGVAFDGTQDINLPVFTEQADGLVPKRVGATTTKYLREDGSWVTPPNTSYASLTQANAEAGTATTASTISAKVLKDAIQFHAPSVTNIAGNASTATTLQTARTINGTRFNGSASITTTTWGTARTLTLGRTGKPINGSADVSWSADEILPAGVSGQILKHNGTSWVAGTDNNILYSAMTEAEATSGTATTASLITPAVLKSAITSHAPVQTTSTGNAESATKLQTARLINGIAFDGTGDINLDVYSKAETNSIAGTPNATETVEGKAKIATTEISRAGTNDTDIITALKLKQTLEASKSVLAGSVNFNGTGTVSIRSQLNVSSITSLGRGKYRINMTTAMSNANYPVFTSVAHRGNAATNIGIEVKEQTAGSITVCTFVTGSNTATDVDFISVGWTQ